MKKICLRNSKGEILLSELGVAESFIERGWGLLGQTQLEKNQGLWIMPCKSIHTFFMKFSIDCIFLDRRLTVTSVVSCLGPWRGAFDLKAHSVIEVSAGVAQTWSLQAGEVLDVST